MRPLASVFVVAAPTGARIRTRLRPSAADAQVLWAVGTHLGRLAGQDLALRCRLGAGDDQPTSGSAAGGTCWTPGMACAAPAGC